MRTEHSIIAALSATTAGLAALTLHQRTVLRQIRSVPSLGRLQDEETGLPRMPLFQHALESSVRLACRYDNYFTVLTLGLDPKADDPASSPLRSTVAAQGLHTSATSITHARLRKSLRSSDYIARLAPCLFGVLIYFAGHDDLDRIVQRIHSRLAMPYRHDGAWSTLQVHAGIASCPDHSEDPSELLAHALKPIPCQLAQGVLLN